MRRRVTRMPSMAVPQSPSSTEDELSTGKFPKLSDGEGVMTEHQDQPNFRLAAGVVLREALKTTIGDAIDGGSLGADSTWVDRSFPLCSFFFSRAACFTAGCAVN